MDFQVHNLLGNGRHRKLLLYLSMELQVSIW